METTNKAEENKSGFERKQLMQTLKSNLALRVEFTKADGSHRIMICSLHESSIPKSAGSSNKIDGETIKENPNVIRVYDLESKGWRSFRVDLVKSIWPASWVN